MFRLLAALILLCSSTATAQPDPGKYEWIDVEESPTPITEIQKLVTYPADAIKQGIEGTVILEALLMEDGTVKAVDILKSDHPMLEDAAREAMLKARFSPAKNKGKAVKVWITYPIRFKLNEPGESLMRNPIADPGVSRIVIEPKLKSGIPTLPYTAALGDVTSIELELEVSSNGNIISAAPTNWELTGKISDAIMHKVLMLKFQPGEINNERKSMRTKVTFPIDLKPSNR